MAIYGFICEVCGQHSETEFPRDLPAVEKRLNCPNCGAEMYRDFSGIGIGGDLPSRWNHYDPGLGTEVYGKTDRDRKMRQAGMQEYVPDTEQSKYRKEMAYIVKNTAPNEREKASAELRSLNERAGKERRKKIIREQLGQVKL